MKTLLVVDDSEVTRNLLRAALESDEWRVKTAQTADEALTLARKLEPDAIIVDFVLPDADGLVLLRELRRWGVSAPVIALTGASSTEIAYRFIKAGAADFLVKDGLTSGDVRSAVRRALVLRNAGVLVSGRGSTEDDDAATHALLDDPADEGALPAKPLRVLVVDDTSVARAAVKGVLGREGWEIREAEDVKSALDAIRGSQPDVVLLDYLLPDVDGVEAIRVLRDGGLRAPVIALTGHGSEDLAVRFLQAGASDFLGKEDLSEERFVHAILRAVAAHAAFARRGD